MSDKLAVMFEGQIAQIADPQTLYRRPLSREVAEFIGTMNLLPADLQINDGLKAKIPGLGRVTLSENQCPAGIPRNGALLGIRPEMMAIVFPGETPKGATREARVESRDYYGDMTYYRVKFPEMTQYLPVSMKNLEGRPILDPGADVTVSFDPAAMVLLPK